MPRAPFTQQGDARGLGAPPSPIMNLGLEHRFDQKLHDYVLHPVINDRRFSHAWVIGKTGVGKSTALIRWAVDDILAGEGVAFFDPHGDAAEEILRHVPRARRADVIYFNPSELCIGFNPFDTVPEERRAFVASALTDGVKAVWGYGGAATPVLDQMLFNGARAMMDMPDGTLLGLKFLLTSAAYRKRVIAHIRDPVIRDFWAVEFEQHMTERERRERTLSTLNKLGALISDPLIRRTVGQPRSAIDLAQVLRDGKILIVALPQGELGIEKSSLIGSLLMSQLHLAALSRGADRRPFHVYADECHHFGAATLAEMLSGIRKFGVSLTLANQYLDQLPRKLKAALLGAAGTIVSFRIGALDTPFIEPEFQLARDDQSLCELQPY
jgi:type IV secretory pathway TraG/TraD family ATPase VirD4